MRIATLGYFFAEAARSVRRGTNLVSFGTLAVAVLVLGACLVGLLNLNYIGSSLGSRLGIRVMLLPEVTANQREALRQRLSSLGGVKSVRFVTREEALRRLRVDLGEHGAVLDLVEGDDNPLPDSFEVKVSDPERVPAIAASIATLPGVETVDYGKKFVNKVVAFTRAIQVVTAAFAAFISVGIVFIVGSSIRQAVAARRREIEIMKLVGATDWFIRWPFVIEGLFLGFVGSAAGGAALYYGYMAIVRGVGPLPGLPLVSDPRIVLALCVLLVVVGSLTGAVGSAVFMRRYLDA